MNFHTTTASRISKVDGTTTVEHRATLHYSYTNRAAGVNNIVVVDENIKKIAKTYKKRTISKTYVVY